MFNLPFLPIEDFIWAHQTPLSEQKRFLLGSSEENTDTGTGEDLFELRVKKASSSAIMAAADSTQTGQVHRAIADAELNRRTQRNTLIFTLAGFVVGGIVTAWAQTWFTCG